MRSCWMTPLAAALTALWLSAPVAMADEGMWLFNHPPKKQLKEKYNFDVTDAWLNHQQHSAVRVGAGGSGSFVSPDGLMMTNHHVGAGVLAQLSTKERDLLTGTFYARTRDEEIKCPDLELNVLQSIEDVTDRVNGAVTSKDPVEAEKQRRAIMNTIEKESQDKTGLRSDVVTLYQGGLYHLYRYKKYNDVRLVFTPEQSIASFGGDPDNFEYPRFDLDICFFRVYENGQPVKTENYLKWNPAALTQDQLVFVVGHPGRTSRMNTVHHLEFIRDNMLPSRLADLYRQEVLLKIYGARSAENARRAKGSLLGVENSRKAMMGRLAGLQDPAVMAQKRAEQEALLKAAAAQPELAAECAEALKTIDNALATTLKLRDDYSFLEQAKGLGGSFGTARTLLRYAVETAKPNADRLREFRDSNLPTLKHSLLAETPYYADLAEVQLADALGYWMEKKGANDPMLLQVLAGKSPQARAAELIRASKLHEVAERKKYLEGGLKAIEASDDPMFALAKLLDQPGRDVRAKYEQQVEEPMRVAYAKLANARFKLFGTNIYPDATFSLRLAYGPVKGYTENGKAIPPWTTVEGLFQRNAEHNNKVPFDLPKEWLERRGQLNPQTQMNFVSTADIIGGNSGSPVVNRDGELVGIIFDGNLQSLVWDYVFTEEEGRSVSVNASVIVESLEKVYDAGDLVKELLGSPSDKSNDEQVQPVRPRRLRRS